MFMKMIRVLLIIIGMLPTFALVFGQSNAKESRGSFIMGIISDVHADILPDAEERMDAFITITDNELILQGVQSEWRCEAPDEKGIPKKPYGCEYSPSISNHSIKLQ